MKPQLIIAVLLINSYLCIKLINEVYQRMIALDNTIVKMIKDPLKGNGENLRENITYYLQALYEVRKEVRVGNKDIMPQAEKLFKMDKPNFILGNIDDKLLMKVYLWESYEVKIFHELSQDVLDLWISSKCDYNNRKAIDIKYEEKMKNSNFTEEKVQDWWGKWDIPELDENEDIQLKNFKSLFD